MVGPFFSLGFPWKKQQVARWALLLFIIVFHISCASYTDETRQIRQDFQASRYESALSQLDGSRLRKQKRNRLLFTLERAMILDRLGERDEARKMFHEADRLVDELFTVSMSREAATYLVNEASQQYLGEDYEKVAIHTMLALSFLEEGHLEAAEVQARRINTRLNQINSFYDESKNRYKEDAFARYLAGMIFEARKEWDSAIVDYRRALELYEGDYTRHFSTSLPADLVAALHRLYVRRNRSDDARLLAEKYPSLARQLGGEENLGELIVIHELGTIANKQRNEFIIPWGREIIRLSFPIIYPRSPHRFARTGVRSVGRPFISGQLVQNMDKIAEQTLSDRRTRLVIKQGARLVLKSQMTQQIERNYGSLAGLAANLVGVITETADTRSWNLLPSAFYVSRYRLQPGKHSIQVYTNGRLSQIHELEIKAGEFIFLRDRS